ncbi:MAG: hypothetical protein U1F43_38755 [Myxococcota bacterium]
MTTPTPVSSASDLHPERAAASALAEVIELRGGRELRLPADFAVAALRRLLTLHRAQGEVVEGPCGAERCGRALAAEQWAVRLKDGVGVPLKLLRTSHRLAWAGKVGGDLVFVYPKYSVALSAAHASRLLRALEDVKPELVEADGRPAPWVPLRHVVEVVGAPSGEDDDATLVSGPDALPPAPAEAAVGDDGATFIASDDIRRWYAEVTAQVGVDVPLTLVRGRQNRLGFTSGRVWFDATFRPLRVHLNTCPNADKAEILATIVHELAHPLSRTQVHGDAFKRTLVELAARLFGEAFMAGARAHLERGYTIVDYWVATGIRAALRGGEPPAAKAGDDGQLARVLTKIRKLRELGSNQLGLPEGIAATATANDLTDYDLGDYAVRIDSAGCTSRRLIAAAVFEDGARGAASSPTPWRATATCSRWPSRARRACTSSGATATSSPPSTSTRWSAARASSASARTTWRAGSASARSPQRHLGRRGRRARRRASATAPPSSSGRSSTPSTPRIARRRAPRRVRRARGRRPARGGRGLARGEHEKRGQSARAAASRTARTPPAAPSVARWRSCAGSTAPARHLLLPETVIKSDVAPIEQGACSGQAVDRPDRTGRPGEAVDRPDRTGRSFARPSTGPIEQGACSKEPVDRRHRTARLFDGVRRLARSNRRAA